MYKLSLTLALACALVAGCRDEGKTALDLGGVSTDMAMTGPTTGATDMAPGAKMYTSMSIAKMRTAGTYGPFELDGVVLLAVNPSGSRLYVQDAAGGDLSAIVLACSSTSVTHPCALSSTTSQLGVGHQLTVKGTYERGGMTKGYFETFYIDTISDGGMAAAVPAPTPLTMADIQKSAAASLDASRKHWFQKVQVTLGDALVVFDLSPPEFKTTPSSGKTCPNQFGFAVVPMTGAPAAPPAACDATCAQGTSKMAPPASCVQPTAVTTANAGEILIGTDFYNGFTYSADCKCYAGFNDSAVLAGNSVASGTVISGILVYNSPSSGSPYVYLAPTTSSGATPDFKFTN